MLQRVTITNDSDRPILVVPLDDGGDAVREDAPTHVLPGRSARLLVHELRYLAVYAEEAAAATEPRPDRELHESRDTWTVDGVEFKVRDTWTVDGVEFKVRIDDEAAGDAASV